MSNNQCAYCRCMISRHTESTSLLGNTYLDNPDIIKPCGCDQLAHKYCLIHMLDSTYKSQCDTYSESYNLTFIEKASCLFNSLIIKKIENKLV